jgi:PEP-CTERM motif
MTRIHASVALAFALIAQAPLAHAAFTELYFENLYDDVFVSSLRSPATDSFNDLTANNRPDQLSRHIGDYAYTVSAPGGLFVLRESFGSPRDQLSALSTNAPAASLTFSQFTGNASAIGMFIFATNADGSLANTSINTLLFTATDSAGATYGLVDTWQYSSSGRGAFFGLKSDSNIVSFTVSARPDSGVFVSVDGLVLGAAAVPEPATVLQLLAGLGLLGLLGLKRQAPRGAA